MRGPVCIFSQSHAMWVRQAKQRGQAAHGSMTLSGPSMTCDGDALFLSTCDKETIRQLRELLVSAPRGRRQVKKKNKKTPERENELLLRLAPCVDTGVGSDLFSKGTKRTQTHLGCFVFLSAVPQCFLQTLQDV